MQIRFREAEACEPQPNLAWDTVWVQRSDITGGYGEWLMAGPGDQPESRGGLRAEAALHTATLLCLFTDRRLPEGQASPAGDSDPRGWWGNGLVLEGEPAAELGSLLWTLERVAIDDRLAQTAEDIVAEALAVLADQGAVAKTDVTATLDRGRRALLIEVVHWSHTGERAYEQRFGVLWDQTRRNASMNFGDGTLVA